MNTVSLYEGMILRNYKELHQVLDIKYQTGKARQIQIDKLKGYCAFRREGHKYIITKIFDTPITKRDGRKLARCRKYFQYLEVLIKISWQPEHEYMTYRSVIKRCAAYSTYYEEYLRDKESFCKKYNFKNDYVEDFFNEYFKKVYEIFKGAIINLTKREEIISKPVIMVSKGSCIIPATIEEETNIKNLEKIFLAERGINSKYARYTNQYAEINKKVISNEELKQIRFYYRAFKVSHINKITQFDIYEIFGKNYTFDLTEDEDNHKLKNIAITFLYINLSTYFKKRFSDLHQKSFNENKEWNNFRRDTGYLDTQQKLISMVFDDTIIRLRDNLYIDRK